MVPASICWARMRRDLCVVDYRRIGTYRRPERSASCASSFVQLLQDVGYPGRSCVRRGRGGIRGSAGYRENVRRRSPTSGSAQRRTTSLLLGAAPGHAERSTAEEPGRPGPERTRTGGPVQGHARRLVFNHAAQLVVPVHSGTVGGTHSPCQRFPDTTRPSLLIPRSRFKDRIRALHT